MEHDIFERQRRGGGAVEDAADDNGVVGRIEVAQQAAGELPAPAEQGTAEQAIEVLTIQSLEELLEVVAGALRAGDELAATDLAHQLQLLADFAAVQI